MLTIQIDDKEYQVEAGQNLLQAFLSLGLDLPYFCWHPAMGSIGACRQCAVVQFQNAEDQQGRIVMGCMTPVCDGAIYSFSGDKAEGFRKGIVESLMLNHPHDCPVCAEGGECHLQDMTVMVGHRDRKYSGKKNTHRNQNLGPLIHHEMNRCITCYRCTRFYNDYAGGGDLAAMAAHDHVYFGRHEDGVLESEFAGNLVEVCPTGVFTDKPLVESYTRKWDLQSAPSVCTLCAVGCNTLPGERYGKLKRVHNRFNDELNGYFLCDRGRFGASFVNSQKSLNVAGIRSPENRKNNTPFDVLDQQYVLQQMVDLCQSSANKIAAIGSPRASVEANYLLRLLVGADNYAAGFSNAEQPLVELALTLQQNSHAVIADIKSIESADAILVLGEDITNTAPRLALALRQSVRNKAYQLAAAINLETWQDSAVRNLAQDQRSPLFIATVANSRLDDIAETRISLAPDDIARLGYAIAAVIAGESIDDSIDGFSEVLQEQAVLIANALKNAQRPLIISGTSCGSQVVMQAAAEVSEALCHLGEEPLLNLIVAEANSLGQVMLTGSDAVSLRDITKRAQAGEIDTLVVMENDLYRRGQQSEIDALLNNVNNLIVLDGLDNPTLSASSLAIPAASFAETEGTLINLQGRAQRHYSVFAPRMQRQPSWYWLLSCMQKMGRDEVKTLEHFDDITQACANDIETLAQITDAAPDHHYRNLGVKIPRQTHRYSGRTAMSADISVHEPKQAVDNESPLAFTMEGLNRSQPSALLPYVWSPGWNSNQSLHKFQSEVGAAIKGGSAGVKLFNNNSDADSNGFRNLVHLKHPTAFSPINGQWLLVPRHRIFGSDELSLHSPAIAELIEPAFIEISTVDAEALNVLETDNLSIYDSDGHQLAVLAVRINHTMTAGCAGYSIGLDGTHDLPINQFITLYKVDGVGDV